MWEFSKLGILLAGIMLFALLWSFHTEYRKLEATLWAAQTAKDLASTIDETAATQGNVEVRYRLPQAELDNYSVKITGEKVEVLLQGINASAHLLVTVQNNASDSPDAEIIIQKKAGGNTVTLT